MATLAEVKAYLGDVSWSDGEIQDALDAENAAQAKACNIPTSTVPADLENALMRRVQRNLTLRNLPLAVLQGDAEAGNLYLPGRDPEIRRLESPYRRLVAG